jgi:hypothetical protein
LAHFDGLIWPTFEDLPVLDLTGWQDAKESQDGVI